MDNVYEDQKYSAIVKKKNGKYYLICSSLGLSVENSDLTTGFNELSKMREECLNRLKIIGVKPAVINNMENGFNITNNRKLSFVNKSILIMLCVSVVWVGISIKNSFSKTAKSIREYQAKVEPQNIKNLIVGMANTLHSMSPEKKEDLRKQMHLIVSELQPYFAEIKPLFIESNGHKEKHAKQ